VNSTILKIFNMDIMFVARKKRKENIAEFILYMFQVEDLIRAFNLDMELIKTNIISKYDVNDSQRTEITGWYENLVKMMEKEGTRYSGHLQFLNNHINDLNELHLKILQEETSPEYSSSYKRNIGLINEFRLKGNVADSDITTCINAVYGYLLLKIQKKEVSAATEDAIRSFANLLGLLSELFKEYEKGNLEL
jgi:hypothetical protein